MSEISEKGQIKVAILTQNEKVFLNDALIYLINNIPDEVIVDAVYFFGTSPYGRRMSSLEKFIETYKIFGIKFIIKYVVRVLFSRCFKNDIQKFLCKRRIDSHRVVGDINSLSNLDFLKNKDYDLLISIGGNQIYKSDLIKLPRLGILNLHTSLLPLYRGLMPTFWVLRNGEKQTGVSVFWVDKGIDTGPILVQKVISIETNSLHGLIRQTKKVGMHAIIEAIEVLLLCEAPITLENMPEDGSYFGFPKREDVEVFLKNGNIF